MGSRKKNPSITIKPRPGGRPQRVRLGRSMFILAVLALLLVLGAVIYRFASVEDGSIVTPPQVSRQGLDPAIDKALDQAQAEIEQNPRSDKAWGRLGMLYLAYEYHAEAAVCLRQAGRLASRDARWAYYCGLAVLHDDPEESLRYFRRAVDLSGKDADLCRLKLVQTLLALDRLDEAEEHLARVNAANSQQIQLDLGRLAMRRGQYEESLIPLRRAAADSHTRKAAQTLLAQVHQRLGNADAAEEAIHLAAGSPDDQAWPDPLGQELENLKSGKIVLMGRARQYFLQNRHDMGIALLEQVVKEYPNEGYAWFMLGKVRFERKLPDAEKALRRAVELTPDSVHSHFYLGMTLAAKGDRRGAQDSFQKAIQLKPDFAMGHYNLGICYLQQGDSKRAIEAFETTLQSAPGYAKAHLCLGELFSGQGETAKAIAHLEQAIQLAPADAQARKLLQQVRGKSTSSP